MGTAQELHQGMEGSSTRVTAVLPRDTLMRCNLHALPYDSVLICISYHSSGNIISQDNLQLSAYTNQHQTEVTINFYTQ